MSFICYAFETTYANPLTPLIPLTILAVVDLSLEANSVNLCTLLTK